LGSNIARSAIREFDAYATYKDHESQIPGCHFLHMDILDRKEVFSTIKSIRPNLVIHTAGLVNVDYCEQHPSEAWEANVNGTVNVVEACREVDAKMIYISTNAVFDGARGMYCEEDRPHVLSVYAKTKLEGEIRVQRWLPESIVVRTAFYGWSLHNRNTLAEWVLKNLRHGKTIKMFTDAFFSPVLASNLAEALIEMYRQGLTGTYHVDGSERCSKYEFGRAIARIFKLDESNIEASSISESGLVAPRPRDISLDISKVSKAISTSLLGVEDGIAWFKSLENSLGERAKGKPIQSPMQAKGFIQYGRQWIDDEDIRAVVEVLRSEVITQGPKVEEFEKAIADYCETKYAVAVNSGTSALHIACLASGIKEGDEAITTPITFVASANCAAYCGAKPVFADINKQTYNISPNEMGKKITPQTRIVIPVHFAGQSCDMEIIHDIVRKAEEEYGHKIFILEDACHALGSLYKGERVGGCRFSDMVVMSFHPVKHVTSGEGGIVLTNDESLYKKLKLFRSHGITSDPDEFVNTALAFGSSGDESNPIVNPWYYEQLFLGHNYRITDIQCALGLSQLRKLDSFQRRRKEIVHRYNQAFQNIKHLQVPVESVNCESNLHLYVLRIDFTSLGIDRARFMLDLKDKGIQTQVHYIPVHLQPFYKNSYGTNWGDCPNAEHYYEECLSIPLYPAMTDLDIHRVITEIQTAVEGST